MGPGTALGAALVGAPAQEIAALTALPNAAWLLALGPVCWRLCAAAGVAVPGDERLAQMAMLLAMAAILVVGHWLLPFEVLGILAAGAPLLFALWRADPPRDGAAGWARAMRALAPYAAADRGVAGCACGARAAGLAALCRAARLSGHACRDRAAGGLGGAARHQRRADPPGRGRTAPRCRDRRWCCCCMCCWRAGWPAAARPGALAQAAAEALGAAAPYAVPPLGLVAGMVTGSNVGSNAALMPVQKALGLAAGLPPLLAPSVHNFAGAAGAGMSVGVTALICGLLRGRHAPGAGLAAAVALDARGAGGRLGGDGAAALSAGLRRRDGRDRLGSNKTGREPP